MAELLLFENQHRIKDLSFTEVPSVIAKLLHQLIKAESFWKEFKEIFNIQNEIPIRDDILQNFRNEIPQFIAESFFDLSEEL